MRHRFQVLLHAPFYSALRELPGEQKARFRRLVRRLSEGDWGGGTRVKKLRGCGKPVFEARQDQGDRVLFTMASSAAADGAGRLASHLQVWDLVPHDRVGVRAARLNLSPEAEFLDFEEIEAESIGEPPLHPAASFEEVPPAEPNGSAGVLELMLPPDGFQPHEREEIVGGVRWYRLPETLLADESEWQALADRGGEELELKLTAEQYGVVRAPGPVLLSGAAGSGKTTISVHRLAAAVSGPAGARALYLTYSRWLLDHARRLFDDLVLLRGSAPALAPEFLTIDELYRTIIQRGGGEAPNRVVGFSEFGRWYAGLYRRSDAALAWEEIRSIVKGACLDARRPMLGRAEYEALGRKRAPLFVSERVRLFEVARKWQDRLLSMQQVDEIDLCRQALLRTDPGDRYAILVCDEAQDLAEIQVALLLKIHDGPALEGLFLAGDPQQVINPSGFRWAEVRTAIRERFQKAGLPTPALSVLTRNYRSVRGLVDLANEVLALKRERTGRSEGDEAEESLVAGTAPVRVEGDEGSLLRVAEGFGPRCAILVGSESSRDRLQALLHTTRIFTVPEAKGLEFDVVILWGLLASDPAPWISLLDPERDLREDPACRRALHHLYVAITRSRRHLAIYEPAGAPPLWSSGRFAAKLDVEAPDSLDRLFARTASPAEWFREAEYFLERGRHRQAAECFRRGGDERREAECLALHHEASGDAARAAREWRRLGKADRAARCHERAGEYAEAARSWEEAGDTPSARRCRILTAEAAGDWTSAASEWESMSDWGRAARCWSNAGQRTSQLRCLATADEASGAYKDAAPRWEEIRHWERAAAAWHKAGRRIEALRAEAAGLEATGRWAEAAEVWTRAGEAGRALRCTAEGAEREKRWEEAANARERLGEYAAAQRAWRRAGKPDEAERCEIRSDISEGRYLKAAEAFERRGDLSAAAEAWMRAHAAGQQPGKPLPLVLPKAAARAWRKSSEPAKLLAPRRAPRYRSAYGPGTVPPEPIHDALTRGRACAITASETAGRFEDAERLWLELEDPGQALRCRVARLEAEGRHVAVGDLLEKRGFLEDAAKAYQRAGQANGRLRCEARLLEKRGRLEDAAQKWEAIGETKQASRCRANLLDRRHDYDEAAVAWQAAGETSKAQDARIRAALQRGDITGAIRIAEEKNDKTLASALRSDTRSWLEHGRRLAGEKSRLGGRQSRAASAPGTIRERAPVASQMSLFGEASRGAAGSDRDMEARREAPPPKGAAAHPRDRGGAAAQDGDTEVGRRAPLSGRKRLRIAGVDASDLDPLVEIVKIAPGLTCGELARFTGVSTAALTPMLREAVLAGRIEKVGRTRGVRYFPVGPSTP